jgi:hypothetical protein
VAGGTIEKKTIPLLVKEKKGRKEASVGVDTEL